MYCPNCKEEHPGKFCPECGTKLIEKPAKGLSANFGDANAISGGVHLADSHNVHNEDKSVHNISNTTSNVTNITNVSAQKTEMELLQERKTLYLNACKRAYDDNVLEQSEKMALDRYRIEIGLDEATADRILDQVRQLVMRNAQKTELTGLAKIKLKQLTEALKKNEVQAIMRQIDSFEALAGKFANDELQYKYYLVLAALRHEKCIEKYEKSKVDNYWKSFWTYFAYLKANKPEAASEILYSLDDLFPDYPEDNAALLAAAGSIIKNGKEEASDFLSAVTGEYTPALQRFAETIYLLLEPETAKEMGADENTCAFYLVNFFGQKDPKAKAEEERKRKEAEEAERKRQQEEEKKRKAEEKARREAEEKAKHEAEAKKKAEEEARLKDKAECSVFDVILQDAGREKLKVVKAIYDSLGLGLKKAKDIVDKAPCCIKGKVPQTEAKAIKRELEDAGATVLLRGKVAGNKAEERAEEAAKKTCEKYSVQPQTAKELRAIIVGRLRKDKNANLNDIDISKIRNMTELFKGLKIGNIDISMWDVSNVYEMYGMFWGCENFNCDLSKWDVSNVMNMGYMFYGCKNFNCDLSNWDVSNVMNMESMFRGCDSLENKPGRYKS